MKETQVVIIGGGIAGTMLARELSKYKVDVTLIEKRPDVAFGVSKTAMGYLYFGMAWNVSIVLKSVAEKVGKVTREAEAKKEELNRRGFYEWKSLLSDLDIPSLWTPVMQVATNDAEMKLLDGIERETIKRGMEYRRLDRQQILELEPNVNPDVVAGLYDDKAGWFNCYPWEQVIAVAENAHRNGVEFMLDTEVIGFSRKNGFQIVETTGGPIKTEFVVNAAGADAVHVARLADACNFSLQHFKAHVILMDKKVRDLIRGSVAILAGPGRMKSINPTQSNNLLLTSIYTETKSGHDLGTEKVVLDDLFGMCRDVIPALSKKDIITYYAVSRVYSARDPDEYIYEFAPNNPRFMNMVLRMPGFIPMPVIAREVAGMLSDHGLQLTQKDDFNRYRKRIPRFSDLSNEERAKLIAQDPGYGHVVCRCETVTEGEIVEAIKRGANTVDGVKFRTRAGMGRCQGSFCGSRVIEILARELNIKPTEVTKNGGNSWELLCPTKHRMMTGMGVRA